MEISRAIPTIAGLVKNVNNQMTDVLKHDYLRRSMEQRVQRKALYDEYMKHKNSAKQSAQRSTNASRLRSQSVIESHYEESGQGRELSEKSYETGPISANQFFAMKQRIA